MTLRVEYGAYPERLSDGTNGVILARAVLSSEMGGASWKTRSFIEIRIAAEDALSLVRAYRARGSRICDDVDDGSRRMICLNMIPGESYSLEWWVKGKIIEDDLWSDWPEAFMAEIENAAKEAGP
ncbi:MAG: hypothetical protein IKR86_09190 [Candidatus Methanomethylophilaceae archaeon]|nr:hypothetical protein [Candidatus Methanomethylophilaceae archaeon]